MFISTFTFCSFLRTVEGTCWVVKIGAISGIRKERVRSVRVFELVVRMLRNSYEPEAPKSQRQSP